MSKLANRKMRPLNHRNLQVISGKPIIEIFAILASDLIGFAIAIGIVSVLRFFFFPAYNDNLFDPQVIRTILTIVLLSLATLTARSLYPGWGRSSVTELKQIIEAITIAYFLTGVIIFIQRSVIDFSRSVFILSWFFVVIMLPVGRFLVRKWIARFPWWGEPVVVIGLRNEVRNMIVRLNGCPRLGLRPAMGLVVDSPKREVISHCPVMPWSLDLQKELKYQGVQTNIMAISTDDLRQNHPYVFRQIELSFKKTVYILDKDIFSIMMAQPVDIAGQPGIISRQSLFDTPTRVAKQLTELLMILVILFPILIIGAFIALMIKLDSPGPIFYVQDRVGRNRRALKVFKFRTMVQNADEVLRQMLKDPKIKKEWDTYHKLSDDRRITRVGRWLRRFSMDELPQFINVLKGEMALIGPRPLIKAEIDEIGEAAAVVLHVRPGLTGWWQVMGRNNLTFEERTRLDLYYVYNWSLWLDLFIFIKTFWIILTERGEK